jgi:hypothetical protein
MFDFVNTDPFLVFFGSFYLVMGLSVFFARKPWEEFMGLFAQNDAVSLIMGIITLPISLFIVVFYNDWVGAGSKILMVIGYLGILKALLFLLNPAKAQALLEKCRTFVPFWAHGLLAMLIGVALITL